LKYVEQKLLQSVFWHLGFVFRSQLTGKDIKSFTSAKDKRFILNMKIKGEKGPWKILTDGEEYRSQLEYDPESSTGSG
jgi:hypothetical protein